MLNSLLPRNAYLMERKDRCSTYLTNHLTPQHHNCAKVLEFPHVFSRSCRKSQNSAGLLYLTPCFFRKASTSGRSSAFRCGGATYKIRWPTYGRVSRFKICLLGLPQKIYPKLRFLWMFCDVLWLKIEQNLWFSGA